MQHETQKSVHEWCMTTFPRYVGKAGRAIALIEEAVELALAAGVDRAAINAAVKVPMLKEDILITTNERKWHAREDAEEVADVLLCLYAYAEEAGYDVHQELDTKMALNRTRNREYYAKKTAVKENLGFILPGVKAKCRCYEYGGCEFDNGHERDSTGTSIDYDCGCVDCVNPDPQCKHCGSPHHQTPLSPATCEDYS